MIKKTISIIIFISALTTLIFLGTWQLQRLEWKKNIIGRLTIEYAKDPQKNIYTLEDLTTDHDLPILYGSVKGYLIYDKEIRVGPKPHDGKIGYIIITPLKLNTGGYILINRGWIEKDQTQTLAFTRPKEEILVIGIFRKPDWNRFTPNNSPENDIWTKLDIDQIADVKNITPIAPVMLYAHASSKNFGNIQMQKEKWQPRNKHKQYAIFWFTMAFALIGVFGFYQYQRKLNKV